MAIKLNKEVEARMVTSIRRYCAENMEEEMGDLKAKLFLDFCVRELGPTIYNQAIADAQSHLQDKVAELDGTCHETEFSYWTK